MHYYVAREVGNNTKRISGKHAVDMDECLRSWSGDPHVIVKNAPHLKNVPILHETELCAQNKCSSNSEACGRHLTYLNGDVSVDLIQKHPQ